MTADTEETTKNLLTDLDKVQIEAELEELDLPIKSNGGPGSAKLWEKAHLAGFAPIFADLLNAEDGGRKLSPLQAFFCGWYSVYKRTGGKDLLKLAGLPTTMTGAAAFLNRQRQTLYDWMSSDWFDDLGVDSWVKRSLRQMLPDAMGRLHHNIVRGNGSVSNGAIKIAMDAYNGNPANQQEVQVNDILVKVIKGVSVDDL